MYPNNNLCIVPTWDYYKNRVPDSQRFGSRNARMVTKSKIKVYDILDDKTYIFDDFVEMIDNMGFPRESARRSLNLKRIYQKRYTIEYAP